MINNQLNETNYITAYLRWYIGAIHAIITLAMSQLAVFQVSMKCCDIPQCFFYIENHRCCWNLHKSKQNLIFNQRWFLCWIKQHWLIHNLRINLRILKRNRLDKQITIHYVNNIWKNRILIVALVLHSVYENLHSAHVCIVTSLRTTSTYLA